MAPNHIKLRITWINTEKTLDEVCEFLTSICESCAYCREGELDSLHHTKKQPHSHFYLYNCKYKYTSFRNKFSAFMGSARDKESGNALWASGEMKPTEGDEFVLEYLAYMMKEPFFFNISLDPKWVLKARDLKDQIKSQQREKKASKRSQLVILKELLDEHYENHMLVENPNATFSSAFIAKFVVDYYIDSGQLVRRFHMTSLVDTLCLHYVKDWDKVLISEIEKSLQR